MAYDDAGGAAGDSGYPGVDALGRAKRVHERFGRQIERENDGNACVFISISFLLTGVFIVEFSHEPSSPSGRWPRR